MAGLRVLIVEDDPLDAELIVRELTKSGFDPQWSRVETPADFLSRLAQDPPDVIISDNAMPQFSSAGALTCLQDSRLTIPFIVVSHSIGEEEAVQLIRNGAADYLMKDRLGRIGEAVRQALEQQRLRVEHATAQQAVEDRTRDLVASHHSLRALASELTLAEQRERKRLSEELHDYLAQMLALGRMKMAQLRKKVDSAPMALPLVQEIDDLFAKALTYTRSLMAKLSPPVLDELGLPAALRWLAEQMPLHGLAVEVRLEQEKVPLPDDQAVLLFQSVRELLINTAKHAGTDRATVALRIDDDQRLCIEVRDEGRGFDVALLDQVLASEHFGLLSVRERMEAMGGQLDVKSKIGEGTTMTLTLPLAARDERDRREWREGFDPKFETQGSMPVAQAPPVSSVSSASHIRVLLVDDHVMLREGLRALLDGHPVVSIVGEAGDGQEGVAEAARLHPDVVLMDVNMPGMDGIEATKRIKQSRPETVVLALSVNNSPHIREAMINAGASSFVSKDAAAGQLYEAILATMAAAAPPDHPRQLRLL
jgi:signal transduction histidine kinase